MYTPTPCFPVQLSLQCHAFLVKEGFVMHMSLPTQVCPTSKTHSGSAGGIHDILMEGVKSSPNVTLIHRIATSTKVWLLRRKKSANIPALTRWVPCHSGKGFTLTRLMRDRFYR